MLGVIKYKVLIVSFVAAISVSLTTKSRAGQGHTQSGVCRLYDCLWLLWLFMTLISQAMPYYMYSWHLKLRTWLYSYQTKLSRINMLKRLKTLMRIVELSYVIAKVFEYIKYVNLSNLVEIRQVNLPQGNHSGRY